MSSIDKQALIAKIKKQTESFDTVVLKEDEANALLDELDSVTRTLAVNHEAACSLVNEKDELMRKLEAEQRISSTWRKTAESNREKLEAAEKRIAELEAREVTLPRPVCIYVDHSYPAYSERQVVALVESLGIRINGED